MIDLSSELSGFAPADELLCWQPSTPADNIRSHFSDDDWRLMVADIDSADEWETFLRDNPDFVRSFTLHSRSDDTKIAFCYILVENDDSRLVSFHGGCFGRHVSPFLNYRATVLLLRALFARQLRVCSSCHPSNKVALRFLQSLSFTPSQTIENIQYLSISPASLARCAISHRFNSQI